MEKDKSNDTSSVDNNVITGFVSDADCNNSHGTGLSNAKSFRTLNSDSEQKDNLELFENDEKVRDTENNLRQVVGGIDKLSQQICCSNILTFTGEDFCRLSKTKLVF